MTEHAGLIQVITFRPAPGDVMTCWLCAPRSKSAAVADGCFGAQTRTRTRIRTPWRQSPGSTTGAAWRHPRPPREAAL